MKKYLLTGLLILTIIVSFAQKPKEVTHFNIVFAPDLSNRLNPKLPLKLVSDADVVGGLLEKIWPDILRYNRDLDQLDHYSVDFMNKGLIGLYNINTEALHIDFQRFQNQIQRINYIKGKDKDRTLNGDIAKFAMEYRRLTLKATASSRGADIWTYFQSGIDDRIVLPSQSKGKLTNKFRNIMILMTDGYIEAGIFGKGFDLSESRVESFRRAFLKSKESNLETFLAKNKQFRINPVKNPYLNNLEVIVMEMYDRSLSKTGAATKHPTDMEIMKVIWSDWLKASGVKRFALKPVVSNKAEAVKYILDFIRS